MNKASRRHCYAIRYARAHDTSIYDTLAQFDSRESRAQWLEIMADVEPEQWEAVTLADVRRRFDVKEFGAPAPNYFLIYTQDGTIPFIYQRYNYQL